MAETLKFICRKRKQKTSKDVTWINTDRMPYYNSAMISLYAGGETELDPGFKFNDHLPLVYWTLEYICEGEYLITKDENRYRLSPGNLVILHPGFRYAKGNPGNMPVKKKEIMLNNSPLLSILCNRSALNGREMIRCSDPGAVEAYFDRVLELISGPDPDGNLARLLANTVFSLFTEIIDQCRSASVYNSFDDQLRQLNVFSPDLTLERMADHFKVSIRTLNRLFNKHLNCSPFQYLIAARMKYAAQLLRCNTLSIKNVAEECGYKNTSFFISEFKKYFSRTPLEYRKELGIFDDHSLKMLDAWNRKNQRENG